MTDPTFGETFGSQMLLFLLIFVTFGGWLIFDGGDGGFRYRHGGKIAFGTVFYITVATIMHLGGV